MENAEKQTRQFLPSVDEVHMLDGNTNVTRRSVNTYKHFGGTCYIHLYSTSVFILHMQVASSYKAPDCTASRS
jgi:hypothetical protein